MSLTLIQGYSSSAEEEEEDLESECSDLEEDNQNSPNSSWDNINNKTLLRYHPTVSSQNNNASSALPSALDAFAQVSGPPGFLNNCVEEPTVGTGGENGRQWRHGRKRNNRDKKDLPAGVVVEAKPQLVGIHERVRSDIEGGTPTSTEGGKRLATVANPSAEDAAELLRMCLQCGVPKTFSNAKGMVCPICGDRPPTGPNDESAKRKDLP